ncbi:MAG: cell division protein CrgA [Acidimicrobiales bacterium]|nr:cell division protein CrgA [Acidimicrobiales bacterium]
MADETNEPTDTDADGSESSDESTEVESAEPAAEEGAEEPAEGSAGSKPSDSKPSESKTGEGPKKVVAKKKVVSKRVTPKGGHKPGSTAAHAHAAGGDDAQGSSRYTPPTAKYQDMPSPTWVPVLMFALLGFGGLFIIANYAGAFGDPENWRLLVGLAAILGGIIAATNYR